ncbi:Zn-dependent hydrolase [Acuticoccus mangrovi]|uniref:Zn-dependent hydrolase n=1 Tax=Acuticoccus mangrovi TaxID=2796142 RepID=A0A934MF27_9HYPH|nr:Zn-dependent hydrolase [Acuticoccus mangrovi]MBJ3775018.1 Zn-dependent hydrolase [Acuticoccus mangrovi]
MTTAKPTPDSARLRALFDAVNAFGLDAETGGFDRPAFSPADMEARAFFADEMRRDGLEVAMDGAGNVCGRFGPAAGPVVMIGSHLDTVPSGGAFDGTVGCAVALECVRALRDAQIVPRVAVEVVATADEEGRFGGMLGSQALVGTASPAWVERARDADGVRLADAMRAAGLDPAAIPSARRAPGSVAAFLEMHIEQGPVLEAEGLPIGLANVVSGVCVLAVTLTGTANHSGTTPMDLRRDAFTGLAKVGAALPGLARRGTRETRLTIGHVELVPNAPHTIAGEAHFTVIIRDTDRTAVRVMKAEVEGLVDRVAEEHDLGVHFDERSWIDPTPLDANLLATVQAEAAALGLPAKPMASGAGHDAQTMAALCPSALVFVPSRDGISHAPQEWTDWADIERGALLMLRTLATLVA